MKRKLLSGSLRKGLIVYFLITFAGGFTLAMPGEDVATIMQKCVGLPGLQKYFQNANGSQPQHLYVMRHGVSFEDNIQVMKFGSPVIFLDKLEMSVSNINDYVLFYIFDITGSKARVDFTYKRKNESPRNVRAYLELGKEGDNWVINKNKIEEK